MIPQILPECLMFPEPPDAPDALVDVGKACDSCGRNLGMFPLADICQYCRPKEQDNGDVIYGIATSNLEMGTWERLPNSTLMLDSDNTVTIHKGRHKDVEWLNGPPKLSTDRADTFIIGDEAGTMYWVDFGTKGLSG